MDIENNLFIYILKLEHNKYYVGKTKDLFTRFDAHRNGSGSAWTKKYRPLFVERIIEKASPFDEDKFTKEYMSIHGIDNVRGGTYVTIILSDYEYLLLSKELRSALDHCLKCGNKGHFISNCKERSINQYIPIKNNHFIPRNNLTRNNNSTLKGLVNITTKPNIYIYVPRDKELNNNLVPQEKKIKNNNGKKWLPQDDQDLCKDFDEGITITNLAKTYGRSEYAIHTRLGKLGKKR